MQHSNKLSDADIQNKIEGLEPETLQMLLRKVMKRREMEKKAAEESKTAATEEEPMEVRGMGVCF